MDKIDFAEHLNPEQLAAATAPDGPLLVLAAAGTGKTRTLVYRVAYLVEQCVDPREILLLTFTNRAAREMLDRARDLVGPRISGVWGGTFHHMANRILRRFGGRLGYDSDFTILDREDSLSLISGCIKAHGLKDADIPKKEVLMGLFSAATNTETELGDLLEKRFDEGDMDREQVVTVCRSYQSRKRKLDSMDFDDLLVNCLRLLREHADVLSLYQSQFRHILVDEYQDTNTIQADIVDRLAAGRRNLMVVGDDFQSIYSWRGADYRNILSFPARYSGARVYKLETNYRSVPEILAIANACIAGNPEQFQKVLRATREPHCKPRVSKVRSGEEQSRYVVEQIRNYCREGYRLSDMALLYRAHYHAMEVQLELAREGIPYVITSGVRFFEQAHIKDVCSILRVLENPGDEIAFARLLELLPGVGPRTVQKAWTKMGGVFTAVRPEARAELRRLLPVKASREWAKIEAVLAAYEAENLREDAGEVIHRFLAAFYADYAVRTYENGEDRTDDINELILYTAKFDTVQSFLSDVALVTNLDAEEDNLGSPPEDCLKLSTVHQAKGLEWPVVIMLWVTDGMFPSARSVAESEAGEAEERRLFYVAVTRAKDELQFCVPEVRRNRDGSVMYCTPSRFLTEIPRDLADERRPSFI